MEQEQNEKQEIAQSATVELTTADGKKKKNQRQQILRFYQKDMLRRAFYRA